MGTVAVGPLWCWWWWCSHWNENPKWNTLRLREHRNKAAKSETKKKHWHGADKLPDNRVSFLLSFTQSCLNRLTTFNVYASVCVSTQSNRWHQFATPLAIQRMSAKIKKIIKATTTATKPHTRCWTTASPSYDHQHHRCHRHNINIESVVKTEGNTNTTWKIHARSFVIGDGYRTKHGQSECVCVCVYAIGKNWW